MRIGSIIATAIVVACPLATPASADLFEHDDPLALDDDRLPIEKPAEVEIGNLYDFLENTFTGRMKHLEQRALNVNTLGEVPDSSWFNNRLGTRAMALDEFIRGGRKGPGPDLSRPWTVIRGKSGGITPGFTIRDGRGDVYFVKFDPKQYPSLSTPTDVVSGLFFHAFGYSVPANYIAFFRRDQLLLGDGAKVKANGKKRLMRESDLDQMLGNVKLRDDGTYRCIASLLLEGEPLGPFKYRGTRAYAGNDIFVHQHRRELRGLRVFSAWLNHDDSRSINSLDMFIRDGDSELGYVRHHLIDFSSTLGSGSNTNRQIAPQHPRAGNEYILERGPALRSAFTFGIWDRSWRGVHNSDLPEIGHYEADYFRPHKWRPEYPNPAFERMQNVDAFWAARILEQVTDDMIRAAVNEAQYDDPASVEYLAKTMITRRDKVIDYYYRQLNPVSEIRLEEREVGARLSFENLGAKRQLAITEGYDYEWLALDNVTGDLTSLTERSRTKAPSIAVVDGNDPYVRLRIRTESPDEPNWNKLVEVTLRRRPRLEIVGIDREN